MPWEAGGPWCPQNSEPLTEISSHVTFAPPVRRCEGQSHSDRARQVERLQVLVVEGATLATIWVVRLLRWQRLDLVFSCPSGVRPWGISTYKQSLRSLVCHVAAGRRSECRDGGRRPAPSPPVCYQLSQIIWRQRSARVCPDWLRSRYRFRTSLRRCT